MGVFDKLAARFRLLRRYLGGSGQEAMLSRGAAGVFFIKVGAAGLGFLTQLVLTRLMGADSYGKYIYAISWMNFGVLAGTLGFTTASVRFLAEYHGKEQQNLLRGFRQFSRRLVWGASTGIAILMATAAWLLIDSATQPELLYTFWGSSLMLPLLAVLKVHCAELRGLKRVVRGMLPQQIARPALLLIAVCVFLFGLHGSPRADFVMGLHVLATALALGVVYWLLHRANSLQEKGIVISKRSLWWTTARDMLLVAGFNLILFRADTVMVGALLGTTESGLYAIASKVATLLSFVIVAVNMVLSPQAADLHAQERKDELQHLVTRATQVVLLVSVVGAAVLWIWNREILGLFGEKFAVGAPALNLLAGGYLANAFAGPAILLLNMTDYQNASARILGVGAVLNIILNALLIPRFGLFGAALATALTMAVWNAAAVVAVWRNLNLVSTAFAWPSRHE